MKRALLLLLILGVTAGPVSAVIDPFYRNQMERGVRAFEQGDWELAARQLRIACFGHLDEPVALADGLVRLAITDVRRGDEESFRRIFSRMAELEGRFSAYRAAPLPLDLRRQFETLAARLIPAQTLRATEGFHSIAERAEIETLGALPPAQRRAELQRRLQAEPERADWLNELAKLELEGRHPKLALDWLDRLPAAAAGLPPATCLRQQAASESGSCDRMDLSQPFCPGVPPTVIEFRLQCLVAAARWSEASSLILGLDPVIRARRRVARLERKVRNDGGGLNPADPAAGESTIVSGPPSAPRPAAAERTPVTDPAPTRSPVDPQELDRLRKRLASAATSDDLAALMSDVESLADRHPDARQARLLAAEVAYLRSDWRAAVGHFRQAGKLRSDEAHLAFYQAVALYESGDPAAAAEVLRPVASLLEHSSFVDSYVDRILAPGI